MPNIQTFKIKLRGSVVQLLRFEKRLQSTSTMQLYE